MHENMRYSVFCITYTDSVPYKKLYLKHFINFVKRQEVLKSEENQKRI